MFVIRNDGLLRILAGLLGRIPIGGKVIGSRNVSGIRERGIPNMVLTSIRTNLSIALLDVISCLEVNQLSPTTKIACLDLNSNRYIYR